MARPPSELQAILKGLDGVEDAYIQPPTKMKYPCIKFEPDSTDVTYADNSPYFKMVQYTVIVIDRDPLSKIPGLVEDLRYASRQRKYIADGLHHFVLQLFF